MIAIAVVAAFSADAATTQQLDYAQTHGLAWLLKTQDGDGNWIGGPGMDVIGTATALDSLKRAGITGYPYTKGTTWLANTNSASTDALARQISTLASAGMDVSILSGLLSSRSNKAGTWGSYKKYSGSFPDTSLAVMAQLSAGMLPVFSGTPISAITASQNSDGGWPYMPYASNYTNLNATWPQSKILPTAYNILVLNRCKGAFSTVQTNLNSAITWLKAQQQTGGGFGEGTGTALETAVALQAIAAEKGMNDSAVIVAQTFLVGTQAADGSWGADPLTTAAVLMTFSPTTMVDTDKDGIPDKIEAILGTNPLVADSRWLASGNGNSVPGVTVPTVLNATSSAVNQAFSFTIAANGTGPFTWKISAGFLPPGLILNTTTGVISGTPTASGNYSIEFTATDANGTTTNVIAQIQIGVLPSAGGHDGDLNGDGVVDVADVWLAQQMAMGLMVPTASQLTHGDINGNGQIDASDVQRIEAKAVSAASF
jgi:hypothetical protein